MVLLYNINDVRANTIKLSGGNANARCGHPKKRLVQTLRAPKST